MDWIDGKFLCLIPLRRILPLALSSIVSCIVPSQAAALDNELVEKFSSSTGVVWRQRCNDALFYALNANQKEDHSATLTEDEVAQQLIRTVVAVYIVGYAHGRNVPEEQALIEIVALCKASPDTPLGDLRLPAAVGSLDFNQKEK